MLHKDTKQKRNSITSSLILLITAIIWGGSFVAWVEGATSMGSFTFVSVRFAIGALALVPLIFIFERRGGSWHGEWKHTLRYGAITGAVVFAASTLQQFGIEMTGEAGRAAFINGLYVVLVPIFGLLFFRRRLGLLSVLGTVSAFAGLYFLSVSDGLGSIALGDMLKALGAIGWSAHIMMIDTFSPRVRPLRLAMVQFATCAFLAGICMFVFEQPQIAQLQAGLIPLLYGGLMSCATAYTLQILFQRNVEPAKAAIIYSMESLFAAIAGFWLLGEIMGWRGYLGGLLMFTGIILSQLKSQNKHFNQQQRSSV